MGQATVWLQFLLWSFFAMAMGGCAISAYENARVGLALQTVVDVVCGILTIALFIMLHNLIPIALRVG